MSDAIYINPPRVAVSFAGRAGGFDGEGVVEDQADGTMLVYIPVTRRALAGVKEGLVDGKPVELVGRIVADKYTSAVLVLTVKPK